MFEPVNEHKMDSLFNKPETNSLFLTPVLLQMQIFCPRPPTFILMLMLNSLVNLLRPRGIFPPQTLVSFPLMEEVYNKYDCHE